MTDPITPTTSGLGAAGITLFGVATGIDPVLLFAGAAGGWWAMTYQPVLGVANRLSRIAISALAAAGGTPLAIAYAAQGEHLQYGVPESLVGFPVAMGIGLLAVDVIGRSVIRRAKQKTGTEETTE